MYSIILFSTYTTVMYVIISPLGEGVIFWSFENKITILQLSSKSN